MRVLLAVDNSAGSIAAAERVAQTSWPHGTKVNIISVVNPLIYSLEEIGLYADTGMQRAHQAINQAVRLLAGTELEIAAAVVAGRPTKEILKQAKLWEADLIVVGANNRQGLKRLVLRSTSEAVTRRAHCAVRVIPAGTRVSNDQLVKWPFTRSATYVLKKDDGLKKAA